MPPVDIATAQQLASPEGWALLQSLPPYVADEALGLHSRLRAAGHAPDLVAAVLAQSRLRARAAEKFGELAGELVFTSDGLEQATRRPIAARHAQRYAGRGIGLVHDLGCGLGADALAFAEAGLDVAAVDADPATAALAAINLRRWPSATVVCARAEDVPLPTGGAAGAVGVWVDPARRTSGVADVRGRTRRVFSLAAISPSWETVCGFAEQVPATGAKLSPAFPHAALPAGAEAQWTTWRGEVLECAVWWGPLVETPGRTAAVGTHSFTDVITEQHAAPAAGRPTATSLDPLGDWLYEADGAVVRAGLTGALVAAVDGTELGAGLGYVTSPAAYDLRWARRHRVLAAMPLHPKPLGRWLREQGHDRVTIKKRGATVDADTLRRQLRMTGRGKGGSEATLVLTRVGSRQVAIVVEPA
jgi:SAM-dependent methyltransferase